MLHAQRHAEMIWEGNLAQGHGQVTVGSKAVEHLPMTWASRVERPDGKTSPEELIAAAHAGCYAMALNVILGEAGKTPERLRVNAACTFEEVNGAPKISTVELEVHGNVPGMDVAAFEEAARKAEQLCPVSNALRNNVAIHLQAHLEP